MPVFVDLTGQCIHILFILWCKQNCHNIAW